MEDIEKKEEIQEETETEDTSPETQEETEETTTEETTEEVETEEAPKDVDYKKELETLESTKPKSEAEKAKTALYHNYQRAKELGVDVAEVVGEKPKEQEEPDVSSAVKREFAERDARAMTASEDEYSLVMWYVNNKGLSVDEAYLLANKGRIERSVSEAKRANVAFSKGSGGGEKKVTAPVPEMPKDQLELLRQRARKAGGEVTRDPKTGIYKGKYYQYVYNHESKVFEPRKLK